MISYSTFKGLIIFLYIVKGFTVLKLNYFILSIFSLEKNNLCLSMLVFVCILISLHRSGYVLIYCVGQNIHKWNVDQIC